MSTCNYLVCHDCMEISDTETLGWFILAHSDCLNIRISSEHEVDPDDYTEWTIESQKELGSQDKWSILYDYEALHDYSVDARYQTFFVKALGGWCVFDGGDGEGKVSRLADIKFNTKEDGEKFCTTQNLAWAATKKALEQKP